MKNFFRSITFYLLIANFLVFFLELAIPQITKILALVPEEFFHGMIWQPFTFMYVHDPHWYGHIFFNMFTLLMFGPIVEDYMESKKFFAFYTACGIGSALFHLFLIFLFQGSLESVMLGASGAIFGVLVAFAYFSPHSLIIGFPIMIPLPAKYAVILFAILEFFFGMGGLEPGVAHWGHLGGMITGFILLKLFFKKRPRFFWE